MEEVEYEYVEIPKWCIRRTPGTCDVINQWFNGATKKVYTSRSDYYKGNGLYPPHWNYLHFTPSGKKLYNRILPGYVEIEFDEFVRCLVQPFIKTRKKRILREFVKSK
jgi:predicted transcriptional regulator